PPLDSITFPAASTTSRLLAEHITNDASVSDTSVTSISDESIIEPRGPGRYERPSAASCAHDAKTL
ncbi:MAG TPA: hypothetical protein PLV68_01750, partial [Ilumatobacteraceae bacterium]|nr:hypothetical protein [Ilumatobacteraceae bacterium]